MNFKLVLQSILVAILLLFVFDSTARPLECSLLDTIRPTFLGKTCQPQELFVGEKDCASLPYQFCIEATDDQTGYDKLVYKLEIDYKTDSIVDTVGHLKCHNFGNGIGLGQHSITITATDEAGNFTSCTKQITVKDKTVPICSTKVLTVEIIPIICKATVTAVSLNNGSSDNCTVAANLRFRIGKGYDGIGYNFLSSVLQLPEFVEFGPDELGPQLVTLTVIDSAGNWSSKVTYVVVNGDLNADCWSAFPFSLYVNQRDEFDNLVALNPQTSLVVNGFQKTKFGSTATVKLFKNFTYKVELQNLANVRNGVSTADLISISKHILSTESITSPYKKIAADINGDRKITTADMVELRKVILHLTDTFSNNTSYRFVNARFDFDVAEDSSNSLYYTLVSGQPLQYLTTEFITVKIGDVNNSIKTGFQEAEARDANSLALNVTSQKIVKGASQSIRFDFDPNFDGLQLTLRLDPTLVKIISIEGLSESNYNSNFLYKGLVPISLLHGESGGKFSIRIEGMADCTVESVLSLTDEILPSISYFNDAERSILLHLNPEPVASFALLQNQPNPFNGKTVIGMVFPEATAATMTIFDATGSTLKVIQGTYAKGYNEVSIDQADLKATGILSYRLTTDKYSATKQMIVAE